MTRPRHLLLLALLAGLLSPAVAQEACTPDGSYAYYGCRADDFAERHPEASPPDYYRGYADRYIRRFSEETRPLLSPEGQRWLDRVRRGLQEAIEARRAAGPSAFDALERDPAAFLDYAYATHAEAYLTAGLSALPLRDLLIIGSTPDLQDLLTPRGRTQIRAAIQGLTGACRAEGWGPCLIERTLRELRDQRRLLRERLRLRPTGTVLGWWVRRLAGSAARALSGPHPTAGLADRLPE